jgi:hypothetical protein
MLFKSLDNNEILRNTIKVYPKNSIFINSSGTQYNKTLNQMAPEDPGVSYLVAGNTLNLSGGTPTTYIDVNTANSSVGLVIPNGISLAQKYDVSTSKNFYVNHRLTSSLSAIPITSSNYTNYRDVTSNCGISQKNKLSALKNTLNWYATIADNYKYENYSNGDVTIINIPSIFYGNDIKKGSVTLNFYTTGTLIGQLTDSRLNGELVQAYPLDSNSGKTAGTILYSEGFILLSGSWNINNSVKDNFIYDSNSSGLTTATDFPRWTHFARSLVNKTNINSSSFELNFQGVDYINTITMFVHAEKSEFNNSINPTFIRHDNLTSSYAFTGSNVYAENPKLSIANTVYTPYQTVSGSFKKQTFINKIGIFDKNKKLIAVAKLATPVKKNSERDYTFKLKLDI